MQSSVRLNGVKTTLVGPNPSPSHDFSSHTHDDLDDHPEYFSWLSQSMVSHQSTDGSRNWFVSLPQWHALYLSLFDQRPP